MGEREKQPELTPPRQKKIWKKKTQDIQCLSFLTSSFVSIYNFNFFKIAAWWLGETVFQHFVSFIRQWIKN